MIRIACSVINHPTGRLKCTPHLQPLLVPAYLRDYGYRYRDELEDRDSKWRRNRKSKLRRVRKPKGYTKAVALGLVSLGVYYWATHQSKSVIQDERKFQPFSLISKDPVSSTCSIFTLRPSDSIAKSASSSAYPWSRAIWSVEFKQPQLQIARPYTPLPPPPSPPNADGQVPLPSDMRFLIRREYNGEVSTYLDQLPVGSTIEIRGPKVEYELPDPRSVGEVLFLAGGTGISPALQVVYALLNKGHPEAREWKGECEGPNIHILWANRMREDCLGGASGGRAAKKGFGWNWFWDAAPANSTSLPGGGESQSPNKIVQELKALEKIYEGKVKVQYKVDEEGSFINSSDILKTIWHGSFHTKSHSRTDSGTNTLGNTETRKKLLFISGPEGFVEFYAGQKEFEGGKLTQGKLGGLLSALKLDDWMVVKL